jgi:hypothetical protein
MAVQFIKPSSHKDFPKGFDNGEQANAGGEGGDAGEI